MSRLFQELTNRVNPDNDTADAQTSKKMPAQAQSDIAKADQACCPASSPAGVSAEVAWRSLNCGICSGWLASSLVLSCGHSFCGQCLFDWINDKPSCPACQVGLRAVPVRSLALDAAVGAFEHLLPEGERVNLKQRTEDGHSAANKLNKMLWWLQPSSVPALGAPQGGGGGPGGQYNHTNLPQQQHNHHGNNGGQYNNGNNGGGQYNASQQQQRGQPPRQNIQQQQRRSSMGGGGCGPQGMAGQQQQAGQHQLNNFNRSQSIPASAMPPMQRATSSGGADGHLFAVQQGGSAPRPPAAARPKSFSGMSGLDAHLGDQLAAARASWNRDSLVDTMLAASSGGLDPACSLMMNQVGGGSAGGGFSPQEQGLFGDVVVGRPQQQQQAGSLFQDLSSHQQEQALLQHLCQSSAFAQAPHGGGGYGLGGAQQQQHAPVVPQAMPPVQEHYLGQLAMGAVPPAVGCDLLLQQHERSTGSLDELLDGSGAGAFAECAANNNLGGGGGGLPNLAMQAQINQLFQSLYL